MTMITKAKTLTLLLLLSLVLPGLAQAEPQPSGELLLPYFEVDLTGFKLTTLFQVTNSTDRTETLRMTVFSNWGIELLEAEVELGPEETLPVNLRDWLLFGNLPDGEKLSAEMRAHLQAALSGQPSPLDEHYYASEVAQDLAVGYVRIKSQRAHGALWGNYYIVDDQKDFAQGDILVNLDRTVGCEGLCARHRLFFLEGLAFESGTELLIWTNRKGKPSPTPQAFAYLGGLQAVVRNLQGAILGETSESLVATSAMAVGELNLPELSFPEGAAGTFDLVTVGENGNQPVESFIAIHYSADQRYSVG